MQSQVVVPDSVCQCAVAGPALTTSRPTTAVTSAALVNATTVARRRHDETTRRMEILRTREPTSAGARGGTEESIGPGSERLRGCRAGGSGCRVGGGVDLRTPRVGGGVGLRTPRVGGSVGLRTPRVGRTSGGRCQSGRSTRWRI